MFQTADRKPVEQHKGRAVAGRRPVYDEAGEWIGSVNRAGGVYDPTGSRSVWPGPTGKSSTSAACGSVTPSCYPHSLIHPPPPRQAGSSPSS